LYEIKNNWPFWLHFYFFFLPDGRWARALPAADLDALLVRLSLRTDDALLAALGLVTLDFAIFKILSV